MATHLARHVRQRRLEQQLNLGQLSKACGYINVSKGINRLKAFEQTGKIHRDLLDKLATALGIDDQTIKRLHDEDFREWEKWVDEPIKPYLVVRYVACMYAPWELPTDVRTQADAEKHASDTARKYRLQVALVSVVLKMACFPDSLQVVRRFHVGCLGFDRRRARAGRFG